jgi:hypothetical protein
MVAMATATNRVLVDNAIVDQDHPDGDHLGHDVNTLGDEQDERRGDAPGGGAAGAVPSRWRGIWPLLSSSSGAALTSETTSSSATR